MGFWSKKEVKAPEAKEPGFSIFNTDLFMQGKSRDGTRIQTALAKTFQKELPRPVGVAMDDSGNNGQPFPKLGVSRGQIPDAQLEWYASQGFIGFPLCAIIAQHWLVNKVCAMPARDAVRTWFDIVVTEGSGDNTDLVDKMKTIDKKMGLKDSCIEFVKMGRVFGIRHALFVVETGDPKYYERPFNIDGIKKGQYKGISQIDPTWISPEMIGSAISDPANLDFYEPTFWIINGKRYHKSHFIIYRGEEVADILKPTYMYGGVSVPQKIYERVYAAERTANEAPMLAMTKRLITMKMNMSAGIANQADVEEKISIWSRFMNNFGVKLLGEDEEVNQTDTSLADVDTVIMTQYQICAAIADLPGVKLLGTSPKGFNATGDYEQESYREELDTVQQKITPLVNRHHLLVLKSELESSTPTDIEWNPISSPNAKDQSAINYQDAQADQIWLEAGAIAPSEVRERIRSNPNVGYQAIPEEFPADELPDEEEIDPNANLDDPANAEEGSNAQAS